MVGSGGGCGCGPAVGVGGGCGRLLLTREAAARKRMETVWTGGGSCQAHALTLDRSRLNDPVHRYMQHVH
jgi:hypothetical protein